MTHVDYLTPADTANEETARGLIEAAWNCKLGRFAKLDALDFYCERGGEMTGVVEIKTRTCTSRHFSTVYLSVRKWLALSLANTALGVPALFVVQFSDEIRWISVVHIKASKVVIAGRHDRPEAARDLEPIIHVPIREMHPLHRYR